MLEPMTFKLVFQVVEAVIPNDCCWLNVIEASVLVRYLTGSVLVQEGKIVCMLLACGCPLAVSTHTCLGASQPLLSFRDTQYASSTLPV